MDMGKLDVYIEGGDKDWERVGKSWEIRGNGLGVFIQKTGKVDITLI